MNTCCENVRTACCGSRYASDLDELVCSKTEAIVSHVCSGASPDLLSVELIAAVCTELLEDQKKK